MSATAPLTCYVQTIDGALVANIAGSVGIAESDILDREIQEIIQTKPKLVVLDLDRLSFMNSLGVGAFVKLNQSVKAGGGAVRIARPSAFVMGVLKAGKMDTVFPIFPTVEAAIKG
jgi:anti-anti-sigma factor